VTISVHRLFDLIGPRRDLVVLKAEIAEDIVPYRRGLQERGRSSPVAVLGHSPRAFVVTAPIVAALCDARLTGLFDDAELTYLATILDIDVSFEAASPQVGEAIDAISEFDGDAQKLSRIKTSLLGSRPNTSLERTRER
jgi:hypothetical protein